MASSETDFSNPFHVVLVWNPFKNQSSAEKQETGFSEFFWRDVEH